ncbi:MAG: hypothetical protein SGPRY_012056, partial [Prymnesium sp.]
VLEEVMGGDGLEVVSGEVHEELTSADGVGLAAAQDLRQADASCEEALAEYLERMGPGPELRQLLEPEKSHGSQPEAVKSTAAGGYLPARYHAVEASPVSSVVSASPDASLPAAPAEGSFEPIPTAEEARISAAHTLQRHYRGWAQRQLYSLFVRTYAALTIQRFQRVRTARNAAVQISLQSHKGRLHASLPPTLPPSISASLPSCDTLTVRPPLPPRSFSCEQFDSLASASFVRSQAAKTLQRHARGRVARRLCLHLHHLTSSTIIIQRFHRISHLSSPYSRRRRRIHMARLLRSLERTHPRSTPAVLLIQKAVRAFLAARRERHLEALAESSPHHHQHHHNELPKPAAVAAEQINEHQVAAEDQSSGMAWLLDRLLHYAQVDASASCQNTLDLGSGFIGSLDDV